MPLFQMQMYTQVRDLKLKKKEKNLESTWTKMHWSKKELLHHSIQGNLVKGAVIRFRGIHSGVSNL